LSKTREPAVILKDVRKSFGDIHAVRDLSAEIDEGCVYGLLGPNASGKSTTMRMIMGARAQRETPNMYPKNISNIHNRFTKQNPNNTQQKCPI
jgi:ABC-type uncharacterized transport system ATPase subunit